MTTILVIDDNRGWRDYIGYMFPDYTVEDAASGEEGIAVYERLWQTGKRPAIVLMDVMLEGMAGVEAAKRIKKLDPEAKILMMSFYPQITEVKFDVMKEDTIANFLKRDNVSYTSKNVSCELLIKKVKEVITGVSD